MSDIVIAGIGQTSVGEHWELSLRELAHHAIQAALQDAGGLQPQALFVANLLAPNLSRQAHLGALIADFSHLGGIEAVTVESGGASGGSALRQAYLAVTSGYVQSALVVGVEKFTDQVGAETEAALATTLDADFEAVQGLTTTAQAALITRRYMHEFDLPADGLAGFAINGHAHAVGNQHAMFQKAIRRETYQSAEMVSEPLNMFDIAPLADGAAAVLLTRKDLLPSGFLHPLVHIAGSASSSDTLALHDRQDPLVFTAAGLSAQKALKKANINLDQVDLFEYFDAYSIYAALSLEAVGLAERGRGWSRISEPGLIPCASMGGLKARGHPLGASGVYQAVEATLQLRGLAGSCQVPGARVALIQSLGGPASIAVSHVLKVEN